MIQYKERIPYRACKSLFQTQLKQTLPQVQKLQTFIDNNHITNIHYEDVNTYSFLNLPKNKVFDLVVFMANSNSLITVKKLDEIILDLASLVDRYFYLAVNKFLLYTDIEIDQDCHADFDQKLLWHWQELLGMQVVWADADSGDRGTLGNFVHPVTNIMFKL
jgi:hypothetical protein